MILVGCRECWTGGHAIHLCSLHAAAPALLEALREHVSLLVEVASLARDVGMLSSKFGNECRRVEANARAAIAQAQGKGETNE